MKTPDERDPSFAPGKRHVTVLESVEEIRALARRGVTVREAVPPTVAVKTAAAPAAPADAPEPFRPVERPSMAVLTVFDDGDDTGEQVRLRAATFLIGRVEGDLVIPHDNGMSGRHAEIGRRSEGGQWRWYLRDLQSTNGTFVRAGSVILQHDQEVLIGRGRFRFEAAGQVEGQPALPGPGPADATRKWQAPSRDEIATISRPSLVELTGQGEGCRFSLPEPEVWIGRDPKQCGIVLNEPTVDPRHARVYRDPKKRWVMENARSLNGLWVRVQEIPLERGGQFQCGEQRFLLKVL